ncbi:MAG: polyamine ABC transporter ATP-binding protein [Opitutae bacterium]|nr:polyamine ABC transporter ATP-binding protein [Opitutae bacterium]
MNTEEFNPIITVKNLQLAYGEHLVLQDVSFDIKQGTCLVVMGGSGCGKSTLLKSMVGLLEPVQGEISISGERLWDANSNGSKIFNKFGVLFQGGALWSSMTIRENVALPLEVYTELAEKEIEDIVRYKLSLVGLSGFENFHPSQLSGGMKKRAGLARALALDPKILFFDEPSAGLDPITSKRLDDLITELKESLGMTFVVISHELASIFDIADDAIFLDAKSKTLLDRGPPRTLLDQSNHQDVVDFLTRNESSNN